MNCSKYLWPMVFASVIAGCSFTGGNAPITDGSATASVYTVKPGDTLYAISSRYGLDPAVSCGATKWEKIDCFFSVVSRYASKDLLETYFTPAQIAALKTLK